MVVSSALLSKLGETLATRVAEAAASRHSFGATTIERVPPSQHVSAEIRHVEFSERIPLKSKLFKTTEYYLR